MRLKYKRNIYTVISIARLDYGVASFSIIKSAGVYADLIVKHRDIDLFEDEILKDGYLDLDAIRIYPPEVEEISR